MALVAGRSLDGPGTDESVWSTCPELHDVAAMDLHLPVSGRVVVVAPHPDDEILGAGGTTAILAALGAHIVLAAVTDGEASAPERSDTLRVVRPLESAHAANTLGIRPYVRHALKLPDGGVCADDVESSLRSLLQPGDLVFAPWVHDGHPDHEQTGLGAERACRSYNLCLLEYLVWAWHWAEPADIPWQRARRVELDGIVTRRKRRAVRCFESQLNGPRPILSDRTVRRLTRPFEVFVAP